MNPIQSSLLSASISEKMTRQASLRLSDWCRAKIKKGRQDQGGREIWRQSGARTEDRWSIAESRNDDVSHSHLMPSSHQFIVLSRASHHNVYCWQCFDSWQGCAVQVAIQYTTKWWSFQPRLFSYFHWHIMCMCHHFIHPSPMWFGGEQQLMGNQRSSIPGVLCILDCCLHQLRILTAAVAAAQLFLVSQKCFVGWLISTQTFSIDVLVLHNLSHLLTTSTLIWMVLSTLVRMATTKMKVSHSLHCSS